MAYYISRTLIRTSFIPTCKPQPHKQHFYCLQKYNYSNDLLFPLIKSSFQWANDPTHISVTPNYIVPNEHKPNFSNIYSLDSIPIIDMNNNDKNYLVHEISKACQDYGFFQLVNHGIPNKLCHNVLEVITDFFHLPYEVKKDMLSIKHMDDGKIFKYYIKNEETMEKIHMWGESFYHSWHPLDPSFIQNLPCNPATYREIIASYIEAIASLLTKLLRLISQSLGLNKDYLQTILGGNPKGKAQANYYPPCPNPELTLGLRDHTDLKILTILLADEGVTGLQVLKAGQWFDVDPFPGALIVNVADQLQVLSKGKYKSARHRVVTNKLNGRASFAIFIGHEQNGEGRF